MRDNGNINDGADRSFGEGRHAHWSPAHDQAVEKRHNFDEAEQADEKEQVYQVGNHDRGNVIGQLLQELSEGFGVRLGGNSGERFNKI